MGQYSLVVVLSIFVHLACIALAWWALQALHFDKFLRANHVRQARVLYTMLAIALGSLVSNFIIDYLSLAQEFSNLWNSRSR